MPHELVEKSLQSFSTPSLDRAVSNDPEKATGIVRRGLAAPHMNDGPAHSEEAPPNVVAAVLGVALLALTIRTHSDIRRKNCQIWHCSFQSAS